MKVEEFKYKNLSMRLISFSSDEIGEVQVPVYGEGFGNAEGTYTSVMVN